jgi:hypothetical protein
MPWLQLKRRVLLLLLLLLRYWHPHLLPVAAAVELQPPAAAPVLELVLQPAPHHQSLPPAGFFCLLKHPARTAACVSDSRQLDIQAHGIGMCPPSALDILFIKITYAEQDDVVISSKTRSSVPASIVCLTCDGADVLVQLPRQACALSFSASLSACSRNNWATMLCVQRLGLPPKLRQCKHYHHILRTTVCNRQLTEAAAPGSPTACQTPGV